MINVPQEIKDILHQDTCPKNIRIHFPNGERADICNDQIVMDSVSFKESLCSQNSFKFGLAESPIFECEVVGVSNIKGATIEVSCEVFCQSTVEDAVWQIDIQQWVYSIPYGTFVVQSADRQTNLIHRKIVAYNIMLSYGIPMSNWEKAKFNGNPLTTNTTYMPSAFYFLAGNNINFSDVFTRVEVAVTETTTSNMIPKQSYGKPSDEYLWYRNNISYLKYGVVDTTFMYVWKFYTQNAEYPLIDLAIQPELRKGWITQLIKFLERWDCPSELLYKYIKGYSPKASYASVSPIYSSTEVAFDKDETLYKTITGGTDQSGSYIQIVVPMRIDLELIRFEYIGQTPEVVDTMTLDFTSYPAPKMYDKKLLNEYAYLDAYSLIYQRYKDTQWGPTLYELDSSGVDISKILNSVLETMGLFGEADRNFPGTIKLKNIKQLFGLVPNDSLYPNSNVYPQKPLGGSIYPKDYQSCWYEDGYIMKYGAVYCTYKDTGNTDCAFIYYLPGFNKETDPNTYKTYELVNNEVINSKTWTQEQIQSICQIIANNIEGVTYMPVKLVGRGLPYVQPGDTFEVLTATNDSITTIVLSRTLKGEMVLTDEYVSVT